MAHARRAVLTCFLVSLGGMKWEVDAETPRGAVVLVRGLTDETWDADEPVKVTSPITGETETTLRDARTYWML